MPQKTKFKPEITRINLDPEQAVLSCTCYNTSYKFVTNGTDKSGGSHNTCDGKSHAIHWYCTATGTGAARSRPVSSVSSS